MRITSALTATLLGVAGLAAVAPVSSAVDETPAVIVDRTAGDWVAPAADVCRGRATSTWNRARCHTRAPGTEFRAAINCTNSGWRFGPWRRQTTDFSTKSTVYCPAGGTTQQIGVDFR